MRKRNHSDQIYQSRKQCIFKLVFKSNRSDTLDNRSDMLDISMEKVCSYLQLLSDDHIN